MNGRKSDTAILSQKSVKTDGEKGCALYSFKNKELCRQKPYALIAHVRFCVGVWGVIPISTRETQKRKP